MPAQRVTGPLAVLRVAITGYDVCAEKLGKMQLCGSLSVDFERSGSPHGFTETDSSLQPSSWQASIPRHLPFPTSFPLASVFGVIVLAEERVAVGNEQRLELVLLHGIRKVRVTDWCGLIGTLVII